MKNTIKTLMIIGALLQGGAVIAEQDNYYVRISNDSHLPSHDKERVYTIETTANPASNDCPAQQSLKNRETYTCGFSSTNNQRLSIKIKSQDSGQICELIWGGKTMGDKFTSTNCSGMLDSRKIANQQPLFSFPLF